MAQVVRYIRRVNGTDSGSNNGTINRILRTVPLGPFASWPGLEGYGRRGGKGPKDAAPRLDPIAVFLLFAAMGSIIGLYVFTPGYSDLTTAATKYVIILAVAAIFAPILLGGDVFREWGPITRPLYLGKKRELPDVAFIGLVASFLTIGIVDTVLTNFGFFPTLSFWNSLTPQIFYASGGIIEEFIFRFVFFGAINRFAPVLLKNPAVFFLFSSPAIASVFTAYHLVVYATSTVALDLVFVEGHIINDTFRLLKYPLWVVMLLHGGMNWVNAP